jgi:hypothetical protein
MTAWLRWIFFITGTLPTGHKAGVLEGTPWTKVWGMMVLSSFIGVETAGTIRRSDKSELPYSTREAPILGNPTTRNECKVRRTGHSPQYSTGNHRNNPLLHRPSIPHQSRNLGFLNTMAASF